LDSDGDFTVFAPTNTAFANLLGVIGQSNPDNIPNDVVRRILLNHVLSGARVESTDITNGLTASTALSANDILTFGVAGGGVTVNGANVTNADVMASNGIIHIVDGVLVPALELSIVNTVVEPAYFSIDFEILTEAVVTAGLLETLIDPEADLTVFAPTDAAFEAAGITSLDGLTADDLTPILTYHVLGSEVKAADLPSTAGGFATTVTSLGGDFYLTNNANGVFINGNSEVVATDIDQDNGVVHVINRTLIPASADIVGVAVAAGFSDLAAALTEAGLVDAVSSPNGPFTVFAPTNDAFQALYTALGIDGPEDIDPLLGDGTLSAVLTYHVLQGRVFSSDLSDGLMPTTLQGGDFTINVGSTVTLTDKDPDVADPTVTSTDVLATNGVIHVIDGILLPIDTAL
jgi:transforming growth factor-beta-induced protein